MSASLVDILAPRLAPLDLDHRLLLVREVIPGRIVFTTSFGVEDQFITHSIFTQGLDIDVVLPTVDFQPHRASGTARLLRLSQIGWRLSRLCNIRLHRCP